MAAIIDTKNKIFSIKNFKETFNRSRARQYMSDMEVEQIRTAIQEKDVMLLGQLYEILLQEQSTDEQIIRDFVMTKNRILDNFMATATGIEKKLVEEPRKNAMATFEKNEQNSAEDILKSL